MEAGQVYSFSDAGQFWDELGELLRVDEAALTLEEMDYVCRNYVAFVAAFMDEYLTDTASFDAAIVGLLESSLFRDHPDRMTDIVISFVDNDDNDSDNASNHATLFIALVIILHLGMHTPLRASKTIMQCQPADVVVSNSKVFRALRRRWVTVTPVLKHLVESSHAIVTTAHSSGGWEERLGTTACAVLYEICRVQKLTHDELATFDYDFVARLFALVEQTRDAEDETFNYLLVKLLIALNEQFMVAVLPSSSSSSSESSNLQAPIQPVVKHDKPARSNIVLDILQNGETESKTFGENVIFILNRANGTPDALSVSLLVLKLLYLLFTTSSTAEYFYTNDLCVLVDVFIRELSDLGPESEGLRHTYLRVLHPLMTNTQLRHFPYKRDLLYRVLKGLISHSNYQACDATTRRLVERNLRASWSEELRASDPTCPDLSTFSSSTASSRRRSHPRIVQPSLSLLTLDSNNDNNESTMERVGSSVSLNAIADANEAPMVRSSFAAAAAKKHHDSTSAPPSSSKSNDYERRSISTRRHARNGSLDAASSSSSSSGPTIAVARSLPTSVSPTPARAHSPGPLLLAVPESSSSSLSVVNGRARSSSLSAVTTSNRWHDEDPLFSSSTATSTDTDTEPDELTTTTTTTMPHHMTKRRRAPPPPKNAQNSHHHDLLTSSSSLLASSSSNSHHNGTGPTSTARPRTPVHLHHHHPLPSSPLANSLLASSESEPPTAQVTTTTTTTRRRAAPLPPIKRVERDLDALEL